AHQGLLRLEDGSSVRRLRLQVVENVKVGSALVGAHEPLSPVLQHASHEIIGQAPEASSLSRLLAHNREGRNKLTVRFFAERPCFNSNLSLPLALSARLVACRMSASPEPRWTQRAGSTGAWLARGSR